MSGPNGVDGAYGADRATGVDRATGTSDERGVTGVSGGGWGPIGMLALCGPLALLGASFLLVVGGLALSGLRPALIAFGAEIAVLVLLVGRTPFPWWRLLPGLLAFASVAWSNWLLAVPRSIDAAVVAGVRVAYFVVPGLVLASFVDPAALGDHLGQRLRLPARPVLAAVAALQRVDAFGEDWDTLQRSRRARGLGPTRSPVAQFGHYARLTFALLVEAIRQAGRMTVAMEARGYSAPVRTGRRRTWAEPAPWTRWDTALILVALALAALPTILAAAGP